MWVKSSYRRKVKEDPFLSSEVFIGKLESSFILNMLTPLVSLCNITSTSFEKSFCLTEK